MSGASIEPDQPEPEPESSESAIAPTYDELPLLCSTGEMLKLNLEPISWLMRPYVPRGGIVLLYGKFGTNKTPLATEIACAVQDGRRLWGHEVDQGRVLFVQADTPSHIFAQNRLRPIVEFRGTMDLDVFYCYPGFDMVKAAKGEATPQEQLLYEALRGAHEANKYDLVVIDSLQSMHTLPDIETQSATIVYRTAAQMLPGAAILFIHHARKTSDTSLPSAESFAGNNAWMNRATSAMLVEYRNEADNEVRITQHKNQAAAKDEVIYVRIEDNIAHFLGDAITDFMAEPRTLSLTTAEQDKELSRRLRCSERTARRRRTDWLKKQPHGV